MQEPHQADTKGWPGYTYRAGFCGGDVSAPQAKGGGRETSMASTVDEELGDVPLERASENPSGGTYKG